MSRPVHIKIDTSEYGEGEIRGLAVLQELEGGNWQVIVLRPPEGNLEFSEIAERIRMVLGTLMIDKLKAAGGVH